MRAWAERCAQIDGAAHRIQRAGREPARVRAAARRARRPTSEPARRTRRRERSTLEVRSWGDLFTESDAFRDYRGRHVAAGEGPVRSRATRRDHARRAAGARSVPALLLHARPRTRYQSPLLDVVGKMTTIAQRDAVGAVDAEPASGREPRGGGCGEAGSGHDPDVVSDTLETYAHWKGITRQALEDIPQIRSTVENRLRQGIVVALEDAIATALTRRRSRPSRSTRRGERCSERSGSASRPCKAAGYGTPNAVLLNPADWAALDIATVGNAGGAERPVRLLGDARGRGAVDPGRNRVRRELPDRGAAVHAVGRRRSS